MKSFLKKHIGLIIFLIIFIGLIIAGALFVTNLFAPDDEATLYGNRLNGIEEVTLKDDTLNQILSEIKKNEQVVTISNRLEGRLLNFSIDVKKDTAIDVAKTLISPIFSTLSEAEQAFYDIQVIITCNEDKEGDIYPVIGYKHKTSSEFVW